MGLRTRPWIPDQESAAGSLHGSGVFLGYAGDQWNALSILASRTAALSLPHSEWFASAFLQPATVLRTKQRLGGGKPATTGTALYPDRQRSGIHSFPGGPQ